MIRHGTRIAVLATGLVLALGACGDSDLTVPTPDEAESYYVIPAESSVEIRGNVAELTVFQSPEQLRKGGILWAEVGPYVYLFSEATRDLFEDFPGLAAVRVVTRTAGDAEVARALLARDRLNALTWKRALNVAGLARRDGTRTMTRLEDLVRWGEEHTDFQYDPDFTRRP